MLLDKDYSYFVKHCQKIEWHDLIKQFEDANIFQTWPYDVLKYGHNRVQHLILKRKEDIVAAAQVRIFRVPILKIGFAYVYWGPMWRKKGTPHNLEVFRNIVRALRFELSLRQNLFLRIYPLIYTKIENEHFDNILREEGYQLYNKFIKRTLLMDLTHSYEELRSSLNQKWRNCLNRAEKNNLEIIIGSKEVLFDEFKKIYSEMAERKGLKDLMDLNHFKRVQQHLPLELKLIVIICKYNGDSCSGGIFSAIGNLGVYIAGATSNIGLKTNGSYMIHWTFVKWLKENGYRFYDLNGINPEIYPGIYHFKAGLAGKLGIDTNLLGKYQVSDCKLSAFLWNALECLLPRIKKLTAFIR